MSEQWLSIIEYARKHGISDMTIRRRIKTGRIKAVLRDGKYFIPASLIANFGHHEMEEEDTQVNQTPIFAEKKDTFTRPHQYEMTKSLPNLAKPFSEKPSSDGFGFSEKNFEKGIQHLEQKIHLALESNEEKIALKSKFYEEKIAHLESKIEQRNQTILHLQQKVEDYETLVNLLEEKK